MTLTTQRESNRNGLAVASCSGKKTLYINKTSKTTPILMMPAGCFRNEPETVFLFPTPLPSFTSIYLAFPMLTVSATEIENSRHICDGHYRTLLSINFAAPMPMRSHRGNECAAKIGWLAWQNDTRPRFRIGRFEESCAARRDSNWFIMFKRFIDIVHDIAFELRLVISFSTYNVKRVI